MPLENFNPATERYVSLATIRRSGALVATPVWIATAEDAYFVFSEGRAGKIKRLRNDPRIRIAACDARGKVRSAWIEGQARVTTDSSKIDVAYRSLRKKYGWQMKLADLLSKLSGRYAKRAMIEIRLEKA